MCPTSSCTCSPLPASAPRGLTQGLSSGLDEQKSTLTGPEDNAPRGPKSTCAQACGIGSCGCGRTCYLWLRVDAALDLAALRVQQLLYVQQKASCTPIPAMLSPRLCTAVRRFRCGGHACGSAGCVARVRRQCRAWVRAVRWHVLRCFWARASAHVLRCF
eukprot:2137197-Rhodomonas_salina.2